MKVYTLLILLIFSLDSSSQEPIRIITNNWTSQIVLSHIAGNLLERQGYQVEYVESSVSDQWGALSHGAAHIQVEVWEGTMSDQFTRLVSDRSITNAGTHTATTREEWWYPSYVEEICPGLPDWQALRACAEFFARPDSQGNGVYYAGPWEKPDEAKVRALNMNFEVRVLRSGDELWIELNKAYKNKTPIVLFNWTPNWVESRFNGRFVEFPLYQPACESDPIWGVNPEFLYDCGNPKDGWLKKVTSTHFSDENSCVFKTLKNISFNNQQISEISALVDVDNHSYQAAASTWFEQNKPLWRSWIPQECQ